ncbi:ankyrin repeat domain-containing protein [Pseudoalteromonas sp. NEC-BIFX-2020_002]|uniref:ankyrin repeat domain-containing protein n=1 Tax=Pseudoalteromonas sp. NEC-BIFX-2020_002 TaxID=2732353 RepID=UPI001476AD73|nr:ankyrin repeat domain-containing protein [Pseudoalteromonas sp. NEC-BIFX-2020_002]NNG43223.1 ankyrin repeat domain-containing protein [Pseudoalteromonas sp. NEC-BIFX-2020_002]
MRNLLIIATVLISFTNSVNAQNTTDTQITSTQVEHHNSPQAQYDSLLAYYFAAARTNDTDVIEQFVEAGIPINSYNIKGYTALMIATYHGNKNTVNTLLHLGANACLEDNRGNTALMAAIFRGEFSIAKTLVSLDCDNAHQNNAGQTAEQFAHTFGQQHVIELLATTNDKSQP